MRIKKFSLLTSIVACGLAVFGMAGCSSDYTVTVKAMNGDLQEYKLTVKAGETVTMNMLAENTATSLWKTRDYSAIKIFMWTSNVW